MASNLLIRVRSINNMHNINQSNLYKLKSHSKLFKLIGTNKDDYKFIKNNNNYHEFKKEIKNKIRDLVSPKYKLKKILQKINHSLMKIETPEYLFSSKKGLSSIDNAHYHRNNKYKLTMDIKSFFPSVKKEYIFRFFKYKMKQSDDIAWTITNMVIIENKPGLPQGFQTSSILSFFSYQGMFNEIDKISKKNNIKFSLYVDDLTFSSDNRISRKFYKDIVLIIKKFDLNISTKKTKFFDKCTPAHITGVVVNKFKLFMPNSKHLKYKKSIKNTEKVGLLNYKNRIKNYNN